MGNLGLATGWSWVRIPVRQLISLRNFGNFVCLALPVSFGRDSKSRRSLLSGVYARGSKRSHQSALEMCNLSWIPHSSLEKDNSLNHSWATLEISLATSVCYPVSMMCSKSNQIKSNKKTINYSQAPSIATYGCCTGDTPS